MTNSAELWRTRLDRLRGPSANWYEGVGPSIQRRGRDFDRPGVYAIPVFNHPEKGQVVVFFPSAAENAGKWESTGGTLTQVLPAMHEVVTGAVEPEGSELETLIAEVLEERGLTTKTGQFSNGLPRTKLAQMQGNHLGKRSITHFDVSGYTWQLTPEQFKQILKMEGAIVCPVPEIKALLANNSLQLRPAALAAILGFLAAYESTSLNAEEEATEAANAK